MKIIITGACAVSSRSVVRSLRKSATFKNSEFVGWDIANNLHGLYEGLFDRIYKVPAVDSPEYYEVVKSIIEEEKPEEAVEEVAEEVAEESDQETEKLSDEEVSEIDKLLQES